MSVAHLKKDWRRFKTYQARRSFGQYSSGSAITNPSVTYKFTYDKSRPIHHTFDASWGQIIFGWCLYMFIPETIAGCLTALIASKSESGYGYFLLIFILYTVVIGTGTLSYSIKQAMQEQARIYHLGDHDDPFTALRDPLSRPAHVYELPKFWRLLFTKGD